MKDQNGWEIIDVYSRKQALADGVQVRCPDAIRHEAGIRFPVFFTQTLWNHYIEPPKDLKGYGQSLNGRLWDVLYMWHFNVKAQKPDGPEMTYKVIFTMPRKNPRPQQDPACQKTVALYSVIGPTDFDDPSPAITIMLPGED